MTSVATIAFYLGVVAYSAAATLFFVDLARRDGSALAAAWAPRALGIGALLHAAHVVSASLLTNTCPVHSIHFALSLSALIAAVAYLVMRRRYRIHALGAFVAPICLTFIVAAQFVSTPIAAENFPSSMLALHVAANLLGIGLFLLAGAAGAIYLLQERRLKAKRVGGLSGRLPPLQTLDLTEHRLLLAGFPLLTLGIVTGAVFASRMHGSAELARAALAYATWVLVAGVLLLRALAGWRGRRAAYGTLAGVACAVLVFLAYAAASPGGGT